MEEMREIVQLIDEEGNEVAFEHLMTFEHGEGVYIALIDADTDPDAEEADVVILRIEEDAEEEGTYVDVEDEAELEAAFATFLALMEEEDDEVE
jgi:uncharacterized protein YrzB (UPF0473 family)